MHKICKRTSLVTAIFVTITHAGFWGLEPLLNSETTFTTRVNTTERNECVMVYHLLRRNVATCVYVFVWLPAIQWKRRGSLEEISRPEKQRRGEFQRPVLARYVVLGE